jgi:hypothetical protein
MQSVTTFIFLAAMAAGEAGFSAECLSEMKLEALPTAPTSLFIYRRCMNTKKASTKGGVYVERKFTRLGQYLLHDVKNNTKVPKIEVIQRARRQMRLQVRLLQRERNIQGEE